MAKIDWCDKCVANHIDENCEGYLARVQRTPFVRKSLDDCTPAEWDASRVASVQQPAPVANALPAAWDLVMADMRERDQFGKEKYGVRLQPKNGRDFLADAYQEALDLAVYLRGAIYERDNK